MTKVINTEWMMSVLNESIARNGAMNEELSKIDWVQNGKAFKCELKFKVIPANSKENNIFSYTVGTHWLNHNGQNKRFVCPEETNHLKNMGVKCPICEAKRRLLAKGFTEEELSVQGKFGLIPVFDPKITSNVKVVVLESDLRQDWDKQHVSILQQNGSFLTRWLVKQYADTETPDFLEWEKSNTVRFTRPTESGKWDRSISFATAEFTPETVAKLKEENEALYMPDLWKMPTDQEILDITTFVGEMEKDYLTAKETIKEATATTTNDTDAIPF